MKQKFKYNVPTHTFFYTAAAHDAKVTYNGHHLMGEYYGDLLFNKVAQIVVEESAYVTPGSYFLVLLEEKDPAFSDYLFNLAMAVIKMADELQIRYYNDLKNNSISDLQEFYVSYTDVFTPAIGLGYSMDYIFDQYIKKNKIDPTTLKSAGLSFQAKEKIELKRIFLMDNENEREAALNEHALKYAWLLNDYTGEHLAAREYFVGRQAEVESFSVSLVDSNISKPQSMLEWMSFLIYLRDERKRANLMANGLMDRYLKQECAKLGLNYEAAVMCTVDEFEALKNDPQNFPSRTERILKFSINGPVDISRAEFELIAKEDVDQEAELTGQTASRGVARGRVKIVLQVSDFSKMEDGDILVASMTRPEFAPIFGKSKAIVTDEGGITCHAAIISRELGIPCIIGTKKATKILKDGDLVEVDADNGTVIIIK